MSDIEELSTEATSECSICLEKPLYPCKLPCGHVFCFLCVKGAISQNPKCALCRSNIPVNYIYNPNILNRRGLEINAPKSSTAFCWYYEGRNGWWKYDEKANQVIEEKFNNNETKFEILIADCLYTIDLEINLQYQSDNSKKMRRIKRDLISMPKKGVAGIYIDHPKSPKIKKEENSNLKKTRSNSIRSRRKSETNRKRKLH